MNKIGYIYKITNNINKKIYIGSTMNSIKKRWGQHKADSNNGSNYRLHQAFRKYGFNNFFIEEIFCSKNLKELENIEKDFIQSYNSLSYNIGYNMILPVGNREDISKCMKNEWANIKIRKERIQAMKEGSQKVELIAVSRFDLSIKEFKSVHDAIRQGYQCLYQSLNRQNKHAYDYCWFHKEKDKTIEQYKEEAKIILGDKYDPTNMRSVYSINIETNKIINFNNLYEAKQQGFRISAIRRTLRGDNKSYKGYYWKFK